MEIPETLVDVKEAGEVVLNSIASDNTKKVFESETDDFRRGAIWGMSWAYVNILSKCTQYKVLSQENNIKE